MLESVEPVIGLLLRLSGLQACAWFALVNAAVVALGLAGRSLLLPIPARRVGLVAGNPVFEAGGTVDVRELPRS